MFMLMNNKSPLAVLRFLIENKGKYHVRQISRETNLSLGFVSRVLHELLEEELILAEKKGRMIQYNINENNPVVKQVKILLTIMSLNPLIKELRAVGKRVILFGSTARGENMPDSDIDLFVISNNSQKVRSVLGKNPNIVPIVMNSSEFINLEKLDSSLFDQINRGIILWERDE